MINTEYISLSTLAENMDIYEKLPIHIQEGLKRSIELTLVTNVVSIPIILILSGMIESASPISSGGFFLWFTSSWANGLLNFSLSISGWLLAFNIISLLLTVTVLVTSSGMKNPVREEYHWAAWGAAFPSGFSVISTVIITVLFVCKRSGGGLRD